MKDDGSADEAQRKTTLLTQKLKAPLSLFMQTKRIAVSITDGHQQNAPDFLSDVLLTSRHVMTLA